jgi:uncharacterized protein with PIN domain
MPIPELDPIQEVALVAKGSGNDREKQEFLKLAAEAYDRMMKEDQERMVTFDQMEDRALEVGEKLERWLMEECLRERGREKAAGEKPNCPQCHKPLRLSATPKERRLRGRTGEVAFKRQECFCPSCRKAFFPSGHGVEAGR